MQKCFRRVSMPAEIEMFWYPRTLITPIWIWWEPLNQYPNVPSTFLQFFSPSASESQRVFWCLLPGCYIILIRSDWHQCLRTKTGQGIGFRSYKCTARRFHSVSPQPLQCVDKRETVLDLGSRFLACLTFWAGTTIASNPIGNSFLQANVFSRLLL